MVVLTQKYLEELWEELKQMENKYLNEKFSLISKDLSPKKRTILKLSYKRKSLKRNLNYLFNRLDKLTNPNGLQGVS